MPVISQYRISRSDLRANPSVLYLFGDNEKRVGLGGQAGQMRGEPNAVGVCTKGDLFGSNEFWTDAQFDEKIEVLENDLAMAFGHVKNGGIVVIPADGLGTGLAQLDTKAPRIFAYLAEMLDMLRKI